MAGSISREWMGMGVAGIIINGYEVDHETSFPTFGTSKNNMENHMENNMESNIDIVFFRIINVYILSLLD